MKQAAGQVVRTGDRIAAKLLGPIRAGDMRAFALNGGYGICQMSSLSDGASSQKEIRGRILVVDDDARIHVPFGRFLKRERYEALHASSEKEALDIIEMEGKKLDIVVTDVMMESRESGLNILSKIKEVNPRAMVVIMTAYSNEELAIDALRRGANAYFKKPMKFMKVMEEINELRDEQLKQQESHAQKIRHAEVQVALKTLDSVQDYFSQIFFPIRAGVEQFFGKGLPSLKRRVAARDVDKAFHY
ncbi:MAG: response regulator, partial [Candidatus Margulisiibacteriota bacterium]